ncbi:MAG: hypothetical protein ACRC78_02640 [Planktothrix sp.]
MKICELFWAPIDYLVGFMSEKFPERILVKREELERLTFVAHYCEVLGARDASEISQLSLLEWFKLYEQWEKDED